MYRELVDAYISALKIPEHESILDFFENGFSLTDDDRFKKFDMKYSPWVRVLCEWFDDSSVSWIYLVFGSQLAKTTFQMGVLLYVSKYVRGAVPCLWVQSTEDEANIFISERLRPFLDESGRDAIKSKSWKKEAFRVNNASVKVGYATAKTTLRSKPARYVIGDEVGIWKETIAYVKKRTRTFLNKRKGVFATTPPEDESHHSVQEMTSGNFYQWYVPCPHCGHRQAKRFTQLKWQGRDLNGNWDHEIVRKTARYHCESCDQPWEEHQKLDTINKGVAVCVDHKTKERVEEFNTDSKTLQINALYSVFTSYGQLAVDFLLAKASGPHALRIFFTDELAEIPQDSFEDRILQNELSKFIDVLRPSGFRQGYDYYTAGIDVQRDRLYYVIKGWKRGDFVEGHTLKYGVIGYRDENGKTDWRGLLGEFAAFQKDLGKVFLDSTDGVVAQEIIDFCLYAGAPYFPIKDHGAKPTTKVKMVRSKLNHRQIEFHLNSTMIKDEISAAFRREPNAPGAWSFPRDTSEEFLRHLCNEHKTDVKKNGRLVTMWVPRYAGAEQHYFSAEVYATAAMEDQRVKLQKRIIEKYSSPKPKRRRVLSKGLSFG